MLGNLGTLVFAETKLQDKVAAFIDLTTGSQPSPIWHITTLALLLQNLSERLSHAVNLAWAQFPRHCAPLVFEGV